MKTVKIDGVEIPVEKLTALGWTAPEKESFPQDGDECWWVDSTGDVLPYTHSNSASDDRLFVAQGNVFHTKEEAEKERDRRFAETKVVRRLRELEGEWVVDWDDYDQPKASPRYGHKFGSLSYTECFYIQQSKSSWISSKSSWVSSPEVWNQVIGEMPEDVKVMMGVV